MGLSWGPGFVEGELLLTITVYCCGCHFNNISIVCLSTIDIAGEFPEIINHWIVGGDTLSCIFDPLCFHLNACSWPLLD